MEEKNYFRRINEKERIIIFNSIQKISQEFLSIFNDFENNLFISLNEPIRKNKFPKIYLILDNLKEIINKVNFRDKIYSAGLFFGYIKKGKFQVSLEGLEFLYKQGKSSKFHHLYVNEKGEKSVLYGNDIIKSMIIKKFSHFNKNDLLIILNDGHEILAITQALINFESIEKLNLESKIAYNLVDKGYYLREMQ